LGFFREPLSGLKRAHCFVLVRTADLEKFEKEEIKHTLQRMYPQTLIVEANYQPQYVQDIVSKERRPVRDLLGKKIFAFAGIGNPQSFERMIQDLHGHVVGFQSYLDHWKYSFRDMERLVKKFKETDAEVLLTTEKDAARLSQKVIFEILKNIPICALGVDLKITQNDQLFNQFLQTL
ncbi:MAG: tetraacyldisaccharide 4'-kinase, partial [Deltaproteobacteria bacterium]|nr:tetraacyldisaccharide 4'-kinase [Deltaproteobacteria bacterium]